MVKKKTPVQIVFTECLSEKYSLVQFHEATEVQMGDLTESIIKAYVDTGEPM